MSLPPDIIFIVLDTQRADRLGSYGYAKAHTPNFDQFARQSAQFEQAIAPAQWTIPSHASMFTGLYPTAHQVTQSNQALSADQPQLAEWLRRAGYETVGFCNNPLVGVLDNGFKRGFEQFYNYCGASPNSYKRFEKMPSLIQKGLRTLAQGFRRFADPIQNLFGQSELAFRMSLNAWMTPIWSRLINFKGQNERSARHVVRFLQDWETEQKDKPLFLFLNLMETHLPFWPPQQYIDQCAPYLREDKAAQAEMRRWNREAYRWAAPLAEPLAELEGRVLSDLYDAEVAYQDAYLGRLLAYLATRQNKRNTLTIIVADHGDGLGEHDMVGHAFNAYQELVHVPLIVNWPGVVSAETHINTPVSTRRVFHTMLEAAGIDWREEGDSAHLSLLATINADDPENGTAFAEIFPPQNFIAALEQRQPALIARFHCNTLRRAIVQQRWKYVAVAAATDELYDLHADPLELRELLGDNGARVVNSAEALTLQLTAFIQTVENQRDGLIA
ncbi:MAG TPA: sulfatase, partial [Anaerolineae bacterium]|nr:sulfatase [Anaerolineae bacterium]